MSANRKHPPVSFNVIWPACIHCGACVAVCLQPEPFVSPFDTIAVETPCDIACMRCVAVCPTSVITYRTLSLTPGPSPTGRGEISLSFVDRAVRAGSGVRL